MRRNGDLNWMNWVHVEVVKPRCSWSNEDGVRRQLITPGDEEMPGILVKPIPAIQLTANPSPRRAFERTLGQSRSERLLQRERSLRQFWRYAWGPSHTD